MHNLFEEDTPGVDIPEVDTPEEDIPEEDILVVGEGIPVVH